MGETRSLINGSSLTLKPRSRSRFRRSSFEKLSKLYLNSENTFPRTTPKLGTSSLGGIHIRKISYFAVSFFQASANLLTSNVPVIVSAH